MAQKETVLLYNFENDPKLQDLKIICVRSGIRIRLVSSPFYLQSIGSLVHAEGYEEDAADYNGPSFAEKMLVMYHFSNELLDSFLRELRAKKITGIQLKAIVTAHNINWNSLQLHEELAKEHAYLSKTRT